MTRKDSAIRVVEPAAPVYDPLLDNDGEDWLVTLDGFQLKVSVWGPGDDQIGVRFADGREGGQLGGWNVRYRCRQAIAAAIEAGA